MGTINHNTKLVPREMQLLDLKVFFQTDRAYLPQQNFRDLTENMEIWNFSKNA